MGRQTLWRVPMPHLTPYLTMVLAGFVVFMGAVAYGRLVTVTARNDRERR